MPKPSGPRLAAGGLLFLALLAPAPTAAYRLRLPECDDTPLIVGTRKRDVLEGTGCYDVIEGRRAGDRINGRRGFDILLGQQGPDRIVALDGEHDVVRGGRGFDRCWIDEVDTFQGCEVVVIGSPVA